MENLNDVTECPLCGGVVRQVHGSHTVAVGSRRVTIGSPHSECEGCGEVFYAPGEMEAMQQQLATKIRAEEGLLPPGDIRTIRDNLGLTQREFETLLNVGPKTVVRWERGTVFQNGATDSLIRLVGGVENAAAFLGRLRGVEVVSPPPTLPAQVVHYVGASNTDMQLWANQPWGEATVDGWGIYENKH